MQANTTAGFSIITWTGTGSAGTIGHGLGVAPTVLIVKNRTTHCDWAVYHKDMTDAGYTLALNNTDGQLIVEQTDGIILLQLQVYSYRCRTTNKSKLK